MQTTNCEDNFGKTTFLFESFFFKFNFCRNFEIWNFKKMLIGFVGSGKIAQALIKGFIASGKSKCCIHFFLQFVLIEFFLYFPHFDLNRSLKSWEDLSKRTERWFQKSHQNKSLLPKKKLLDNRIISIYLRILAVVQLTSTEILWNIPKL